MMYADVILPLAVGNTFTYGVPLELQEGIQLGMRVEVSFGRSKLYAGIVYQLHNNKPEQYAVKPIKSIIDETAIVTPIQLQLWNWISQYYMCSLGEVMAAVLPAFIKLSSETALVLHAHYNESIIVNKVEELLIAALQHQASITLAEAQGILGVANIHKVINSLVAKQAILLYENIKESYRPKLIRVVSLNTIYQAQAKLDALCTNLEKSPKQLHALLSYLHLCKGQYNAVIPITDIVDDAKAQVSHIKALIDKQILIEHKQQLDRVQFTSTKQYQEFTLNAHQQQVFDEISQYTVEQKPILLHGVTGSGKTNIHIKLIEQYVQQDLQVLYLVPEIALTAQLINKLYSYFGDSLIVYHSKHSNNERVETWYNVLSGKAKIILGARSALFLPFAHLGLIIVDEEHDSSYKQSDPAPRYNARDTALILSGLCKANILLSSATPSIDSYYNTQNGKYKLTTLAHRYADIQLPAIDVVDNKILPQIARTSNLLHDITIQAIQHTVQQGKQVVLFQNRRGFAPYLYCSTCGWHAHCRNCDVSVTYHKSTDKLHCHYCGVKWQLYKICPVCKGNKLYFKNYGTERVEEEVKRVFPTANIDRLDMDTANTKKKYQNVISNVENKKTQILIGTQMVAKGLDFDDVQLVGVLSADSLFTYPDYRVNERAYQLLCQVSGRAGRKGTRGYVLIQAGNTSNPYLPLVQNNDYATFYNIELTQRKQFLYPPFVRLIKLTLAHKEEAKVLQAATQLAQQCSGIADAFTIGPSQPVVAKIMNIYNQEIIIKCKNNKTSLAHIKQQVQHLVNTLGTIKGYTTIKVTVDVDY
jgi:primosomal protein N' (replication factor Y) (superfamily II helicase)